MGLRFCSLASGSSGNCQYIASETSSVLLDAGLTGKYIEKCMDSIGEKLENVSGILVSHEHSDHVKAIGILSRRFNIPIYANTNTWDAMKGKLGKIEEENVKFFDTGNTFDIGDIRIRTYGISHDASEPVAFSFTNENAKISVTTDLGYVSDEIKEEMLGSDLLMLESNHDVEMLKMGKYPWFLKKRILGDHGHLSNETAGEVIAELVNGPRPITHVLLGHLSRENNFPELAFETVKGVLTSRKISVGLDINLDLTFRDRVSKVYTIQK